MTARKAIISDDDFISNTGFYCDIEELIENDWDPCEAVECVMNKTCYSEEVKGRLAIKALVVYDNSHDTNYADGISVEEELE